MKLYKVIGSLVFFLVAGCASQYTDQAQINTREQPNFGNKALFADPSLLKPVPQYPGVDLYKAPDAAAEGAKLRTLYIAPVQLWLDPNSEYKDVSDAQIAEISTQLREAYSEAYKKDPGHLLEPVSAPAPDSLVIRSALTDANLVKSRTRLLDFTPIGLVVNGAKHAAGISPISAKSFGVSASGETASGKTVFLIHVAPSTVSTEPDGTKAGADRLDEIAERLVDLGRGLFAKLHPAG